MHSDQAVSLRPGGGKARLFAPRLEPRSSSSSLGPGPGPGPGPGTTTITSGTRFGSRSPFLNFDGKVSDLRMQKPFSERIRYTREELFRLQEVGIPTEVSEEIMNARLDMESAAAADEQEWSRQNFNVQVQTPTARYSEPDTRDWRGRTPLPSPAPEERIKEQQKEALTKRSDNDWREREQDRDPSSLVQPSRVQDPVVPQFSSRQQEPQVIQYSRQQELPPQASVVDARPAPPIVKAANPWSARRGSVSEKEKVLRTVKGILNKLTPEKFEVLLEQLLNSGINSADILQGVISLIFDKAVLEPTFCPMYAEMCVQLSEALPEFPSDEADGKPVSFRRILLNICQEEFEGADNMRAEIRQMTKPEQELERLEKERHVKRRTLGNIRLIGELFKQKMIPEKIVHYCIQELLSSDSKNPPAEENIEALCQLLTTVGKQLEESQKSKMAIDSYFLRLKEMSTSQRLPSRIRFLVRDTIDLRSNKWVPRREEVKAKTINEIHAEAEQKLGLRPGMAGIRNGRGAPGVMGMPGMGGNFAFARPGGMMPGMPGLLPVGGKMPGGAPIMPNFISGMDTDGWETFSIGRKNKREGLVTPPNMTPGRMPGMPVSRPSSVSSKLLPQGSGGLFSGRSALLGDSAAKPLTLPKHNLEMPEPTSYGSHGPPSKAPVREVLSGPPSLVLPTPTSKTQLTVDLLKKSESLLKEYFSVADLNEAMLCVQELQSSEFHPELVQLAVSMGIENQDRDRELVAKLLEFLHSKKILTERDIRDGVLLTAEQLEDLALDTPMGPRHIGELVGRLVVCGAAEIVLLRDVIEKAEQQLLRKTVYDAAMRAIKSSPNSERILSRKTELLECEKLIENPAR